MKKLTYSIATLLLTSLSININAATMEIATRNITNGINNADFISSWSNQSSTIITNSINDFNVFYSGIDSISHLSVDFTTSQAGTWGFEAGLDAHYGAALYIDNTLIGNRTDDLWWSYNWNSSGVMNLPNNPIAAGAHTLDIYWAESCCSGYNSARFTSDGTNWQSLSTANLDTYAISAANNTVPEPMPVALLGLGLVGFIAKRHKQ
jgi:hypothetical protein